MKQDCNKRYASSASKTSELGTCMPRESTHASEPEEKTDNERGSDLWYTRNMG